MTSKPTKKFLKLPKQYREAAKPSREWNASDDNDTASMGTYSWRTFSTSSAPSELLSFCRDAHLHTIGRAINRLGKWLVNPIDNAMARREFKKVLKYLESLITGEDWEIARRMFQSRGILSGLLEAGR
jgi:hypothetical protein